MKDRRRQEKEANELKAKISNVAKMLTGSMAVVASSAAAFPVSAFADEGSGINAILPQMNEFIPMLIAFLVLWFVLAKFGWPVFENMLNRREDTIKEALKKAEEARQESERILAEHDDQLAEARALAAQIVNDAKKSGAAIEADIKASAQAEADEMISKARTAIEIEKKAAIEELQGSVADMTISVAGRVIGNDLSDDEHRAIIERYIKEAGSLNAN
jgi:F-type H+-transporting ATPase subunit b